MFEWVSATSGGWFLENGERVSHVVHVLINDDNDDNFSGIWEVTLKKGKKGSRTGKDFSIAAINDTDSKNQWEPLAPTKEAQANPNSLSTY
uniref:Uncharacterized protein n=1 Tax=Lactuca sativa TaxID=4236 RepID=A0A9R1VYS6_LACSA|nr:hypothetical protein LSAT_V11C300145270 [Lactuca sativa]